MCVCICMYVCIYIYMYIYIYVSQIVSPLKALYLKLLRTRVFPPHEALPVDVTYYWILVRNRFSQLRLVLRITNVIFDLGLLQPVTMAVIQ